MGPRIPFYEYSVLYGHFDPPCGECPICCFEFVANEELVSAKRTAAHVFHKECLGSWANDTAMESTNRCPLDREVLCVGRDRFHGSERVE
jgi:hypothetical protein